jgi:NAD(P)-dependent dehydrogenase (short-subunit alcohol dehydrogenase family)
MPAAPLAGRVAFVAGAGRGIGRQLASWFAAAGADVVACSRSDDELRSLAADIERAGGRALAEPCDVTDLPALSALVERAVDRFGRIDVAVANAAILGPVGSIDTVDAGEWQRTLTLNVAGTAAVVRAVLPVMTAQRHGRILTMSGGGVGGPNIPARLSAYVASKAAVMELTEALALEMPDGVTVNSIAPGAVPTGFMGEVLDAGPDVAGAALFESVRSTAMPDLEPLRELVLYLASDEAGWLNGRCLSARWDPPHVLRELAASGVAPSRFRLRRVDEDLYGDRKEGGT